MAYPPITLPLNTWLGALTSLALYTEVAQGFKGTATNKLLERCQNTPIENGVAKFVLSADVLTVGNYAAASSLLTATNPTVKEQELQVSDYKVIALTINEYFLAQSFANSEKSATFVGYLLSIMQATKEIYMYRALVAKFEAYVPTEATQTVTVDQIDTSAATLPSVDVLPLKTLNSNELARTINQLIDDMSAPTNKYNDQAYTQMVSRDELMLVLNGKFKSQELVYTLATLLNSQKVTDQNNEIEIITIPYNQFADLNKDTVIGWLCHKEKVQYGWFYQVATAFFDGSNLNSNNWLHFAYYLDTVDAYPAVKLTANVVQPVLPA